MTAVVGILCADGIVIGADSALTQSAGQVPLLGQTSYRKIRIVNQNIIAAVAGDGDCHIRCCDALQAWANANDISQHGMVDGAVLLSNLFRNALSNTAQQAQQYVYDPVIGYPCKEGLGLISFSAQQNFQPKFALPDGLWFMTAGSGLFHTTPFLGFLRQVFWSESRPNVGGGTFTAYWALRHACDISPGGVAAPLDFVVLEKVNGSVAARQLDPSELDGHEESLNEVNKRLRQFKDTLENVGDAVEPPPVKD
ncbi:MAG: hypothetical protein AAFX08_09235 [Pseudomonadota bacterium]